MRCFQLMLAAAVVGAPIAAAPTAFAAGDETATSQRKERRICRRQAETGTRLKAPPVCMTQSEWDRVEEEARNDMSASQRRGHSVSYGLQGRSNCPPGVSC